MHCYLEGIGLSSEVTAKDRESMENYFVGLRQGKPRIRHRGDAPVLQGVKSAAYHNTRRPQGDGVYAGNI